MANPPRIAVAVPVRPDRSRTLTPPAASLINRRRTSPSTGIPPPLNWSDVACRSVPAEPSRQLDVQRVEVDLEHALEEGGIANQAGPGDVGVGDRHGSVRNKGAFWLNSSAAGNMTRSVSRICPIQYAKPHSMDRP